MRGFGYSGGARKNSKIKQFLEDLHLVINQCFSDLPLFLYGHSLGGFIAMNYLILNKINVSGVLFTSPYVAVPNSWKITKTKQVIMAILGPLLEVSPPMLYSKANFPVGNSAKLQRQPNHPDERQLHSNKN
jgi:alpha-beta hydrolase superfamily lysophospholipase